MRPIYNDTELHSKASEVGCSDLLAGETRSDLREKHGTPQEFEAAVNRAADQLFLTTDEANVAIKKYYDRWNDASSNDHGDYVSGPNYTCLIIIILIIIAVISMLGVWAHSAIWS